MFAVKLFVLAGCIYAAAAFGYGSFGGYGHDGHAGHGHGYGHDDLSVPTSYKFEYGVKDPHTHDFKSQWEHGDGHHNVKGAYELHEPEGSHRLVEYHADKGGFLAHVSKKGLYSHPKGGHSYHNFNLETHH